MPGFTHAVGIAMFGFGLLAQAFAQTFLVDPANGPGTNFTSLQAAVAAVPDGSTLIVRPGAQSGFSVLGKGLVVLCDPGVTVSGPVVIGSTGSGQGLVVRGMSWLAASSGTLLTLQSCAGPVLLEELSMPASSYINYCGATPLYPPCTEATGIVAVSCPQLYLRRCQVGCTVRLNGCNAIVDACDFAGENAGAIYWNASTTTPNWGRTALDASQSVVQVCGSASLRGGNGNLGHAGVPGGYCIRAFNATVRLLDGQIVVPQVGGGGVSVGGSLRTSPRVTFVNSTTTGADVMPQLLGTDAQPGGVLTATVDTEAGDLVALIVGLPGAPTPVPGFHDAFWIDAVNHVFVAVGAQQIGTPVAATVAVPAGPAFVGLRLNWQAACLGPVTGSQATNPSVTLVF